MKQLTLCYWCQNEERYFAEWIEFHLLQGVDHFIVYDDGGTDRTHEILEPYGNLVEIRFIPPEITQKKNFWIMSHCIDEQKGKTKWLHYHALDERIFSPTGKTLLDILKEFDKPGIGGVSVAWQQIHSSGVEERQPGLLTENFTLGQTEDPMHHIKTVIRPDRTSSQQPGTPHNFHFLPGFQAVNENYQPVSGPFDVGAYSMSKLKNIHYATMSKEEFDQKMNKGVLDGVNTRGVRRADADQWWEYYHNNGSAYVPDLLKYVKPVKEAIKERYSNKPHLLELINH